MLRIALMGDLHYPVIDQKNRVLYEAREVFFNQYIEAFFDHDADWYVSLGDLTHNGYAEEFREVYACIRKWGGKVPFRQVLGNHDVLFHPKNELASLIGHPRYEVVETQEALLVFLDTTKELELHGWGLDAEQWAWLDRQIEESNFKPVLIFAHHPVPSTTTSSPTEEEACKLPYRDIRSILYKKKGTGLFLNGHTHTHSIVQQKQWHFIQTAAPLCAPCFRTIEFDRGQIRIDTRLLEDEDLIENAKTLHDQLTGFHRPGGSNNEPGDLRHVASIVCE